MPRVQGHQNWYSQLSNTQIHKYTNTQIHIYKYTNTAYDEVPGIPNICYISEQLLVPGCQKWYSQVSQVIRQPIVDIRASSTETKGPPAKRDPWRFKACKTLVCVEYHKFGANIPPASADFSPPSLLARLTGKLVGVRGKKGFGRTSDGDWVNRLSRMGEYPLDNIQASNIKDPDDIHVCVLPAVDFKHRPR